MRTKYFILAFILLLLGCSKNPTSNDKNSTDTLAAEAKQAGLEIIETYFNADSATFYSYLPDTIYLSEPGEDPIVTDQIDTSALFKSLIVTGYSMEDYNNTYAPEVLTYDDYKEDMGVEDLTQWKPDQQDYLFLGFTTKDGKEGFMMDDMLAFMLSKRTGEWKIRAF